MQIARKIDIKKPNTLTRAATMSLLAVTLFGSLDASAARFFRYTDDNGQLVMSHTIPNDRVKFGYEIVDENARLIQKIEPQLSEQAHQAKVALENAQKECSDAVRRVNSLYRSIQDIDYAEEQALESIDTLIANNKANLTHIRNQRTELEALAAQQDISGRAISNVLLDNIESAKSQESNLEEQIERRYAEKLQIRKSYGFDRDVLVVESCETGLPAELRVVKQEVRPD